MSLHASSVDQWPLTWQSVWQGKIHEQERAIAFFCPKLKIAKLYIFSQPARKDSVAAATQKLPCFFHVSGHCVKSRLHCIGPLDGKEVSGLPTCGGFFMAARSSSATAARRKFHNKLTQPKTLRLVWHLRLPYSADAQQYRTPVEH